MSDPIPIKCWCCGAIVIGDSARKTIEYGQIALDELETFVGNMEKDATPGAEVSAADLLPVTAHYHAAKAILKAWKA